MSASLCIQVFNRSLPQSEEIRFFDAKDWDAEAEKQLLIRIQELLALVRGVGKGFEVTINMEVSDVNAAVFQIRKKINASFETNNAKLSIREIEILGLIMQGMTNNEIAEKLFISYETVKSHRKHILEKTGARNTAALINHYHQTFFDK